MRTKYIEKVQKEKEKDCRDVESPFLTFSPISAGLKKRHKPTQSLLYRCVDTPLQSGEVPHEMLVEAVSERVKAKAGIC